METLILFAKAPIAGRTKTRLAKERGDEDALRLATAFLTDTAALCGRWRHQRGAIDANRRVVFYVDPLIQDPILIDMAWKVGARIELQQGKDLGERLRHAFDSELARGARAVCVIGSDSPTLPLHLLDHAFRALLWERVTIGPTFDGGYWLVGAQRPAPELFDNIPWSTAGVVARTASLLLAQQLTLHLLPFWYDVDEAADLERLVWHVRALQEEGSVDAAPATFQALVDNGLIKVKPAEHGAVNQPPVSPWETR